MANDPGNDSDRVARIKELQEVSDRLIQVLTDIRDTYKQIAERFARLDERVTALEASEGGSDPR